jgi:hypothetical protein|tara:strand:- start:4553 stop:5023 length:471 start_codon:yes stop_codon:yes gene_type:complete
MSKQKGFSLLGVIVSVFLITVGLTAILTLANISLKGASTGKMRLIASGLTQEGIEVVRNMRKTELDWNDWYSAVSSGDYRIQYDNPNLIAFSDIVLKLDTTTGLYQYDTGQDTVFKRKVTLTKVSSDQVDVKIEVSWQLRGQSHSLIAENKLWNWK